MISSNITFGAANIIPKIATQVSDWEPDEWVRNEIMIMNDFLARTGARQIVDDQQRIGLQYDLILPMQSRYRSEDIYYANPVDRLYKQQVFPYNGKLYDCNGNPINTKPLNFNTGSILVMTKEGALFLSHKERGVVHHSTLLASADVAYACMLEVSDGEIVSEEPWSGHYEPTQAHQAQFHDRLNKNYCLEIPQDLTVVFLTKSGSNPNRTCPISRKPLLEPVKLPCGHTFNLTALNQWYKIMKVCPLDNKEFSIDKVSFGEDLFLSLKKDYGSNLLKNRSAVSELDAKVIQLKLDDRDENFMALSTIIDEEGVMLFLKEDSPLRRIHEIGKAIGCVNDSQHRVRFKVNGRYHDSEKKTSEIKNGCQGIPRVYLFF